MELRSVLVKKKAIERDRIDQIETVSLRKTTVTFPDASDIVAANQLQLEDTLLADGYAKYYISILTSGSFP